jgi:hypothetical protein
VHLVHPHTVQIAVGSPFASGVTICVRGPM